MISHRVFNNLARSSRLLLSSSRASLTTTASSNESPSASATKPSETTSEPAPAAPAINQELEQLKGKLAKCEIDLAEYKDRALRALAETENVRTRMLKQVDDAKLFGIQAFSKDLLEVADVLNLAIANTDPSKRDKQDQANSASVDEQLNAMFKGLVMTETCLLKIFEKHGLLRIQPAQGDKFDPNLHDAIFRIPAPDQTPGTVSVVTKTGFRLKERVLRAAQVGVVQ